MRRAYAKPVMTVERFYANVAATGCTETWDDVEVEEQDIYCYRSNNPEKLFNNESGCLNYPAQYAFIPSGGIYTQADLKQYLSLLDVDESNGSPITVPEGGGVVLIWKGNGQGYCYGLATATITSIINSSYYN